MAPFLSYIEMRRSELVLQYAEDNFNSHVAQIWEDLCREYVSGTVIDGIPYRIAHRWQGQIVIDEANKETKKGGIRRGS